MDPFTEKLLERTRARRENLQRKIAERANASGQQMFKRSREPLADTNNVINEPVLDKVTQASSKPSPSKRRCSDENFQHEGGQENHDQSPSQPTGPSHPDPITDKKPPVGPASIRTAASVEMSAGRSVGPSQMVLPTTGRQEPKITPATDTSDKVEAMESSSVETSGRLPASATGMKSRLQRLADKRKCWDSNGSFTAVPDSTPSPLVKKHEDIPKAADPPKGPEYLERRGRLANLAATIRSWEDDSVQVSVDQKRVEEKPGLSSAPSDPRPQTNATPSSTQKAMCSPVSSRVVSSSPRTVKPSPPRQLAGVSAAGHAHSQDKTPAGASSIKSFQERVGERCQESLSRSPAAGGRGLAATQASPTKAIFAKDNLMSDFMERKKKEREAELAQIRSHCQKQQNIFKTGKITKEPEVKEPLNKPAEVKVPPSEPLEKLKAPSTGHSNSPVKHTPAGPGPSALPADSPSSDSARETQAAKKTSDNSTAGERQGDAKEAEAKVNQSVTSAVITELFDKALEQSDSQEEEEEGDEEDALNISSMSLLAPLAAVVQTPERSMVTSTPECSFVMTRSSPDDNCQFHGISVVQTAPSGDGEAPEEDHKLPYSIDAYRSTRLPEAVKPNMKAAIVRKEDISRRMEEGQRSRPLNIKQQMKMLTNDLNLQQTIIHQASRAINCCTDEEHGKGSLVEAEAERLLLVATARREALKDKLDRLKADSQGDAKKPPPAPDATGLSASLGSVEMNELRLPLKAEFVCSLGTKPESSKHSFFITIRAGADMLVATPLASTHHGLRGDTLTFPTTFSLNDVASDFEICVDVYGLVQKCEVDKKKKPSKSKAITPKRFFATAKSGQTPVLASPGGPNTIRTSNFAHVGSHKVSLSSIGKRIFQLQKVPFLCPLEGHVHLKLQCEVHSKVEERGFLTMFEDVSGFGAWHRRWCVLSGFCISYWKYPDDEKRKNPIGRIKLSDCPNKKVEPANREFCARPNTFELITVRPQREDDKETLVSQCMNTMCVSKNWLSADTKDERNLWMHSLSQALLDLRTWQPEAFHKQL